MRTKTEECERIVLQAMEAIQDEDEEIFSRLIYPIPKQEWKQEIGEEGKSTLLQPGQRAPVGGKGPGAGGGTWPRSRPAEEI